MARRRCRHGRDQCHRETRLAPRNRQQAASRCMKAYGRTTTLRIAGGTIAELWADPDALVELPRALLGAGGIRCSNAAVGDSGRSLVLTGVLQDFPVSMCRGSLVQPASKCPVLLSSWPRSWRRLVCSVAVAHCESLQLFAVDTEIVMGHDYYAGSIEAHMQALVN
jgi:hypothetical protein